MYRSLPIIALLCGMAGSGIIPARADEAGDYLAAAGSEVKALGDCTGAYAKPLIKSAESPERIADDAFAKCEDKAGAVRIALTGDPTHLSDDKAAEVVSAVVAQMKAGLIGDIRKRR